MENQKNKNFYDVVIIGGNISGLACAKFLIQSNLKILLIEKNKDVGKKICAGGVSSLDLEYLPNDVLDVPLQKITLNYKNKTVIFPQNGDVIATIDRQKLLNQWIKKLINNKNFYFLYNDPVSEIISNNSLKTISGKIINFKFLIGADGSNSLVRKYLKISSKKICAAFQYIIDTTEQKFKHFAIYLDPYLFGGGYVWIFPHHDYTSIGCGSDIRLINPKKLKNNFDFWLEKNNINTINSKLECQIINFDYRGFKFKNLFLAGDAAGLASGFTGKGIYSAIISGQQIADDILGNNNKNLIENWLKKKNKQEFFMLFLKNSLLKKFLFFMGMRIVSQPKFQTKAIKFIA
jgi:geranylgeranyl reductase